MSYFPASSNQGYNDGYNSMERTVGPKPPSVMAYPPDMRGVNAPRHFDQRNVDPRQEYRGLENNRFPPHQYQPPIPQRVVDPRQAELRALEARNALSGRGMEPRPMANGPEIRGYDNRPMDRLSGMDRNVNNRMDPRMGYTTSLPNNMIPNSSTPQSNPVVNPMVAPPHVATALFPRPSVSEIVHIPQDLSAFAAEPKFQQILLRVKEQTLVNFISLNRVSDDSVESVTIDASTKEAAQLAKNLIETHLKLQIKVKAAESRLQKVQTDLFSTQGEIAAGQMVEFSIRSDLIGLAIGKKGSRIKQIETETGVSSINVSDNGHIMIYGPDSQSVQQAKEQLELLEESFSLQPGQVDWLSEKTNSSILADLKKDANLMVAKINKDNSALEVVGTSSSVQLTKFLLATQLEYIDKQIEIEANEREAREKLHAVRKQYGLNSVPWKSRGSKSLSSNSPNLVEPAKKMSSGYSQNSIEKSKTSSNKDDFMEAKTDLVPFTFDDVGFTADKTFEEPLEPAHNDSDSKKDKDGSRNRKKNKEKNVEVKQNNESKDRKQGKTRTVEITIGKVSENENGKDNKSKDKSNNTNNSSNNNSNNSNTNNFSKSNLKLEKSTEFKPQTELSSLVVIPPPPQSISMPPAPPTEKISNKGKKNKKQDGGKDDKDRADKKAKEPMLVKINNPFQEQQTVPPKAAVEPEPKDSDALDITFPKKVSGPPKEPPARVVTLIAATTVVSSLSNDKAKDLKAAAEPSEASVDQKGEKGKGNGRSRGRNRKENNNSTHNKVDIISIVTKEQELSGEMSNLKVSQDSTELNATEDKGDGNSTKKSRRRRKQNDKGGNRDTDGDTSPRHSINGDASGEGGLKRVDDVQKSDEN